MLYPSIHWSYKSQPFSNSFPTQGFNINANVAGTIKALSQQSDFIQASFSARFLKTFFNQNTRLLARTSVATTYIDKMDNLPLSMQLFAGAQGQFAATTSMNYQKTTHSAAIYSPPASNFSNACMVKSI